MMTTAKERIVWGWLRLLLGFAQISLAGLTAGSLITVGFQPITLVFALSATLLVLVSILIYKGKSAPGSGNGKGN